MPSVLKVYVAVTLLTIANVSAADFDSSSELTLIKRKNRDNNKKRNKKPNKNNKKTPIKKRIKKKTTTTGYVEPIASAAPVVAKPTSPVTVSSYDEKKMVYPNKPSHKGAAAPPQAQERMNRLPGFLLFHIQIPQMKNP